MNFYSLTRTESGFRVIPGRNNNVKNIQTIRKSWLFYNNSLLFISTVFLGIDHNFMGDGPPILFETMIFNEPFKKHGSNVEIRDSLYERRYTDIGDAIDDHNRIITEIKNKTLYLDKNWEK